MVPLALLIALFAGPLDTGFAAGSGPTPVGIFDRAEQAWESRSLPPFVDWDTDIVERDSNGSVIRQQEHVLLRTLDHWCTLRLVTEGMPKPEVWTSQPCLGPILSPLGFNISSRYPSSTQIDPFAEAPVAPGSAPPIITSTHALHYQVTLVGDEDLDGNRVYHLQLQPLGDPTRYPLRALWVDQTTFEVRKLTYAERTTLDANLDYTFTAYRASDATIWWISRIDARWTPAGHDGDPASHSSLVLRNVSFPQSPTL